jgi:hypothetical protein
MITLSEHDNLADIAWYIKGLIAAGDTTFDRDHVDALKSAMREFKEASRARKGELE